MLVHQFLENSTKRYPDKIAVIHDDMRVTYNEVDTMASLLANHFQANGICKGDRIALILENGVDYILAYYAALKAGAVVSPLNPGLKPDSLTYLLHDLEPAAIVTTFKSERLLKAVPLSGLAALKMLVISRPKQKWGNLPYAVVPLQDILTEPATSTFSEVPLDPETDLASIIYTSGSTGQAKGVMLSHRNITANTRSICQYLSITSSDVQMVVLPFFYVMGKSLLNTHMAAGGTLVINNRFLYPADVVSQMVSEDVTSFSGVPSTYAYLLNRSPLAGCRDKLTRLRYCSQAGGHMAKTTKLALRKALPEHTRIVIMYGATEASARLSYLDPAFFESKIDSIGKPIPDVSIRFLGPDGRQVPDGEEGELVASGHNIMLGYWKDPWETARVLDNLGYHTGDMGYRDDDGFLYITRRKDGLVKVGGHRINPTEIEDFLIASDLIIETAVIGLPDKLLGTKLIALVVPKGDDLEINDLHKLCAATLPNHKCPADIFAVRLLPKNANGKIDRDKCKETALAKSNESKQSK